MALFDDLTKKAAKFTVKNKLKNTSELADTAKTKVSIKSSRSWFGWSIYWIRKVVLWSF